MFPGDPNVLVDGRSLSYDPPYGVDNKTGLQFVWHCQTFPTTDIDQLLNMTAQLYSDNSTSACDDVSTEVIPGQRQMEIGDAVSALGLVFKV